MSDVRVCMHCGNTSDATPFKSKNVCRPCGNAASRAAHHHWYLEHKAMREAAYAADPIVPWVVVPERVYCDYCSFYVQCRDTVLENGGQIFCKPPRESDFELARARQSRLEAKYG